MEAYMHICETTTSLFCQVILEFYWTTGVSIDIKMSLQVKREIISRVALLYCVLQITIRNVKHIAYLFSPIFCFGW